MKRKIICLLIILTLLLPVSCGQDVLYERYEGSFLGLFDTVSVIIGYAESKEAFTLKAQEIYDGLASYHELFDIYNTYDGINNLKTINDNAGIKPVKVDGKMIEFLEFCKNMYYETDGEVNIAMGSVLKLWHDARNDGILNPDTACLPDMDGLIKANEHTDIEDIIIDRENSTVFIADEHLLIDAGAIAKGYAVEMIKRTLPEGYLLSVGGNVASSGKKPDGGEWKVGVKDPENEEDYLHLLNISTQSVVSSGVYQRNYVVNGKLYHHIIDPTALMPADKYTAVTVICEDSGIADTLSTALFLSDIHASEALLEKYGAEAMWVFPDGSEYFSKGFEGYISE